MIVHDVLEYEGCIADMKGYDLAMLAEELLAEVKRLREKNKKQLDVLSTLDEMIRYGKNNFEMMKALEQGLGLPETWKEMIE